MPIRMAVLSPFMSQHWSLRGQWLMPNRRAGVQRVSVVPRIFERDHATLKRGVCWVRGGRAAPVGVHCRRAVRHATVCIWVTRSLAPWL